MVLLSLSLMGCDLSVFIFGRVAVNILRVRGCFESDSGLVPAWFELGSGLVQCWFYVGSRLVRAWVAAALQLVFLLGFDASLMSCSLFARAVDSRYA